MSNTKRMGMALIITAFLLFGGLVAMINIADTASAQPSGDTRVLHANIEVPVFGNLTATPSTVRYASGSWAVRTDQHVVMVKAGETLEVTALMLTGTAVDAAAIDEVQMVFSYRAAEDFLLPDATGALNTTQTHVYTDPGTYWIGIRAQWPTDEYVVGVFEVLVSAGIGMGEVLDPDGESLVFADYAAVTGMHVIPIYNNISGIADYRTDEETMYDTFSMWYYTVQMYNEQFYNLIANEMGDPQFLHVIPLFAGTNVTVYSKVMQVFEYEEDYLFIAPQNLGEPVGPDEEGLNLTTTAVDYMDMLHAYEFEPTMQEVEMRISFDYGVWTESASLYIEMLLQFEYPDDDNITMDGNLSDHELSLLTDSMLIDIVEDQFDATLGIDDTTGFMYVQNKVYDLEGDIAADVWLDADDDLHMGFVYTLVNEDINPNRTSYGVRALVYGHDIDILRFHHAHTYPDWFEVGAISEDATVSIIDSDSDTYWLTFEAEQDTAGYVEYNVLRGEEPEPDPDPDPDPDVTPDPEEEPEEPTAVEEFLSAYWWVLALLIVAAILYSRSRRRR